MRYRGYYFDKETGWYYLQSRYYDPEIGRFINTDLPEYSAACSIRDTNLFMYCHNSPVIYADRNGYDACLVINSDGAHNYGHLSLFVQDNDGCWFYYSFASIENKWKTAIWAAFDNPVEGRVTGVEVGFSDRADLYSFSGFQSFVASTGAVPETAEKMDTTIYIKGNFSKTQQRCANDTGIMCYHAVTFNCMHYAIQRLRVSNQLTKYQQNALKEAYSKYYSPNAARSTLLRLQNVPTIVRNRGGLRRELK